MISAPVAIAPCTRKRIHRSTSVHNHCVSALHEIINCHDNSTFL